MLKVHSVWSNVSMTDFVHVSSTESRIDLNEERLNVTTWSALSELVFDSLDSFANYTAQTVQTVLNIQSLLIHLQTERAQVRLSLKAETFFRFIRLHWDSFATWAEGQ